MNIKLTSPLFNNINGSVRKPHAFQIWAFTVNTFVFMFFNIAAFFSNNERRVKLLKRQKTYNKSVEIKPPLPYGHNHSNLNYSTIIWKSEKAKFDLERILHRSLQNTSESSKFWLFWSLFFLIFQPSNDWLDIDARHMTQFLWTSWSQFSR